MLTIRAWHWCFLIGLGVSSVALLLLLQYTQIVLWDCWWGFPLGLVILFGLLDGMAVLLDGAIKPPCCMWIE